MNASFDDFKYYCLLLDRKAVEYTKARLWPDYSSAIYL